MARDLNFLGEKAHFFFPQELKKLSTYQELDLHSALDKKPRYIR
jgi:hypothetical protein